MTDQTTPPDAPGPEAGAGADAQPVVFCHTQYVKDLSFENPNALAAAAGEGGAPNIDMNIQIGAAAVRDGLFEVVMTVEGKATRDGKHLFVAELQYAGLFTIRNVPQEHMEPVLYIHCPTLLFPFARQIVADITRNGGYPPLLLNPVDFGQLYQAQSAQRQAEQGQTEQSQAGTPAGSTGTA